MRPSLGVDFIDGSAFTARAFFMGVLGPGVIPDSCLTETALLMGALGSDLIIGSRFTAGSCFMACSFLTGGWVGSDRADRAVCAVFFGAGILVDFRAVCFGLEAELADVSSNAGQAAAAIAVVDFRAVCLVFGAGLASTASVFTFLGIVFTFLVGGVEES